MDSKVSKKRFLDEMELTLIDNNKLMIEETIDQTTKGLVFIECDLRELKHENGCQLIDHSFILKKYEILLMSRINEYIEDLEYNFPDSKFSPYINLYLQKNKECKKLSRQNEIKKDIDFLIALKAGLHSDDFKKEIAQQRKYASKYKKEVQDYINGLFDYRSRLLVIRIDLSYRKFLELNRINQSCNPSVIHGFFTKITNRTNINKPFVKRAQKLSFLKDWSLEVQKHRNMLIKQLKKQYSKGFVGYIWKLEYTEIKSFHYHMMFFLDASEHREDVTIAKNIGELWVNEITQGDGLYWNCNANKQHYKNLGVGVINHHDTALRDNMLNTAFYLVKKDYLIRSVMFNAKNRSFGKGQIPQKSKSGRPRKESIKGFDLERNTN